MKIGKYILFISIVALTVLACRETTTDPNIPFETAVHGYGEMKKPDTFAVKDPAAPVNFKWRWVSIEFFAYFDEKYKDKDGNDKVARHGGTPGETYTKIWKTVAPPAANFGFTDFTITQAELYNLYKANKFDYGDGKGSVDVFSRSGRTAAKPFVVSDKIIIRWVLYTADNRRFDSWTTNVCGDFVGANCLLTLDVK
jgi:hypothetical protein